GRSAGPRGARGRRARQRRATVAGCAGRGTDRALSATDGIARSVKKSLAIYRRLMAYTKPYIKGFALALTGMVIAAATEPLFPALMKPLLDDGFVGKSGLSLWYVPAAII